MIRSLAAAAALLSILSVGLPLELPFGLHPPVWIERLLFNPRERTARGIDAYAEERYDDAVAELERARRVAGEPVPAAVDFNAGTARLAAGDPAAALPELEAAVESTVRGEVAGEVDADLAVAGRYNLGNARLAAGDAAGAVEAYKRALRLAPGHADAKHNLELALRRLASSKKPRLKPPRETPGGNRPGAEERSPRGGGAEPSEERDRSGDPGGDRSGGPAPEPRGRPGEEPPPTESPPPPLPGFEDQPDMTAAQAVALLEAVENLEREQRRADAARRARRSAAGRKDW